MRFPKPRFASPHASPPPALGPLEITVMELLWEEGESSVHDVVPKLARPLAYTTVMTTLDRLYKKGLLDRRKSERAFVYSPRLVAPRMGAQAHRRFRGGLPGRAADLRRVADFLPGGGRRPARRSAPGRTGEEDPVEAQGAWPKGESHDPSLSWRLLCLCLAAFFLSTCSWLRLPCCWPPAAMRLPGGIRHACGGAIAFRPCASFRLPHRCFWWRVFVCRATCGSSRRLPGKR